MLMVDQLVNKGTTAAKLVPLVGELLKNLADPPLVLMAGASMQLNETFTINSCNAGELSISNASPSSQFCPPASIDFGLSWLGLGAPPTGAPILTPPQSSCPDFDSHCQTCNRFIFLQQRSLYLLYWGQLTSHLENQLQQ